MMGRIICAWCEKEGKTDVMDLGEAQTEGNSHTVCVTHQEKLLQEIAALKQRRPTANPRRHRKR